MPWGAAAYGLVLLAVAYGIDLMARRASHSLERRQHPGFTYHEDHDAWMCPEDQWLWPQSYDKDNRVMRYRGTPSICNSCPVKDTCTSSMSGREITREVDPWPASEAARFHRGIACTVAGLALVWPVAVLLTLPGLTASLVLGTVIAVIIAGSYPLWSFLRGTPADPTGVLERSADENIAARKAAARAYDGRRTTYRSQRLADASRRDDILGDDLTPMDAYPAGYDGTAAPRPRRSTWREVAAAIDAGPGSKRSPARTRYRSDRIRAEQDAIDTAEEGLKNSV